jgi:septation ring formation regulator EzrA
MDKVIIDGVDVSECKHFYSDEMCDSEQTLSCVCVKNKECEYKQLKRLEQENERLKEEITKLSDPRYQISKVNEGYYNRMNTYKQALQEIRDITGSIIGNANATYTDFYNKLSDILDKINEVIGAE